MAMRSDRIIVIQGWMQNLKLNITQTLILAFIHSHQGGYVGDVEDIAIFCHKKNIMPDLEALLIKGFILREKRTDEKISLISSEDVTFGTGFWGRK